MPPFLQFWLPVALAIALTAIAMYERGRRAIQTALFVLAGIVATAAGTWHIAGQAIRVPEPKTGQVLLGWGSDGPVCAAVLNGSQLLTFADKYGVAIVCGITDASTDKFEDMRITVSPLFTIRGENIPIVVPHSKEMTSAIEKQVTAALKSVPKGLPINVQVQIWYEPVLLPRGANVSAIRRLSDVAKHGGKLARELL